MDLRVRYLKCTRFDREVRNLSCFECEDYYYMISIHKHVSYISAVRYSINTNYYNNKTPNFDYLIINYTAKIVI